MKKLFCLIVAAARIAGSADYLSNGQAARLVIGQANPSLSDEYKGATISSWLGFRVSLGREQTVRCVFQNGFAAYPVNNRVMIFCRRISFFQSQRIR